MTFRRASAVALGTVVTVLLWPAAALAGDCGEVSYQVEGGTALDCGGASAFVAAAAIGGTVLALAVAAAAASYAAGGMPKPELDALIDAQTTTGDPTTAATSAASAAADPAAARAVASAVEDFGLAGDAQATQAVADAYAVTRHYVAPFVLRVARTMLPSFHAAAAADPAHKVVFVGRDGEALALATKELDPEFFREHGVSVVISRAVGEAALRDLEKFFQQTAPEHRRLQADFRRDIPDTDLRRQAQHLATYLRGKGIPIGEPGSVVTLVDSSFKGSVPAMLSEMFRQTTFDAHLIWHGQVRLEKPLRVTMTGHVQEAPIGDRGAVWETLVYEHLLRGPLSSPKRVGADGVPSQTWEHRTENPKEGLVRSVISPRYLPDVVRDAVRAAAQQAIVDYARTIAAAANPDAELEEGFDDFRRHVRNWWDDTGEVPEPFRELLDSFVYKPAK
ncbi:hypothetical protein AB0M36_05795 [Actinoplanes sp. NPDC051346]|uniref:hypothetical protein n=1 Tax=Actinoplanes sp. NPDC051346 TaxID=3155048 RepID=UPI0034452859